MRTELEILDALRETELSPTQEELIEELSAVLKADALWPLQVRDAAEAAFGGGIHNPRGRVHGSIDRRVRHALKVWRNRYSLNPEQMVYAGDVLAWAIRAGASGASEQQKYPFVLKKLERVVHDASVHEGFKRRAGLVDVREQLAGVAA